MVGSKISLSEPTTPDADSLNIPKQGCQPIILARYADILDFFNFCDGWTGCRIFDGPVGNRGGSGHGADSLSLVLVLGLETTGCG